MDSLQYTDRESLEEHLRRADLFLGISEIANLPAEDAFRLRLAALYFGRAVADQLIGHAKSQWGKERAEQLDFEFASSISFYKLVDDVRVQDFHRRALVPPALGRTTWSMQGPIRLTSRQQGPLNNPAQPPGSSECIPPRRA